MKSQVSRRRRCHRWSETTSGTLLAIDELGYLPLPNEAASALFQVVSQRYSARPVIKPLGAAILSYTTSVNSTVANSTGLAIRETIGERPDFDLRTASPTAAPTPTAAHHHWSVAVAAAAPITRPTIKGR